MLHKLCHDAHGPHIASFYKLWDELRTECEELMSKGITGIGEGFDLPGQCLGGYSRQPPLLSLRQTAPLRMHLVLYKLLRWLQKGDCKMIFGVVLIVLRFLEMQKVVLILCRIIWTQIKEQRKRVSKMLPVDTLLV